MAKYAMLVCDMCGTETKEDDEAQFTATHIFLGPQNKDINAVELACPLCVEVITTAVNKARETIRGKRVKLAREKRCE